MRESNYPTTFTRYVWNVNASRGFWALLDQSFVSLGTFLTSILLARTLPQSEYGIFVLICGIIYFLNSLHSALILTPLTTQVALSSHDDSRRIATGSVLLTTLLLLPQVIFIYAVARFLNRSEIFSSAAAAIIFWQYQETMRKMFMAHLRHRELILGDSINYLGQTVLIWAYSRFYLITVNDALVIMAVTSGVAALIQVGQHKLNKIRIAECKELASSYWSLGRWVLMTNLVSLFIIQSFPWALGVFYGAAVTAELQVIGNILGMSHPVFFSIGGLIQPAVTDTTKKFDIHRGVQIGFTQGWQIGTLLLPFYMALIVFPGVVLQAFYGSDSAYSNLTTPLRVFVIFYVLNYIASFTTVILNGLQNARLAFNAQIASVFTAIMIGLPITFKMGIIGATIGCLLTSVTKLSFNLYYINYLKYDNRSNVTQEKSRLFF